MKRCSVCREHKAREEFHRDASRRDGLMIRCRDCDNARARAKYVAHPRAVTVECGKPECGRPHLAKGLCKKHYYAAKNYDRRGKRTVEIGALVTKPSGTTVGMTVTCEVMGHGKVIAICPNPNHNEKGIMGGTSPVDRHCGGCGTTVLLNEEELWVTSEPVSTPQSKQAA